VAVIRRRISVVSNNVFPVMFQAIIPLLFSLLFFAAFGVMIVYGFILLVKFLRAGTKAFDIYVENNRNSKWNEKDNREQK
jgi:TRAP-type C4-dicarboxylate transport system permease small subunit